MAVIDDLKGKSNEELDQLSRQEQTRLDNLLRTGEPDFGLGGPELAPVTDDEVKRAIEDLENAIKVRHIAFLRARQREELEGIQQRTASEVVETNRILRDGTRPKERRESTSRQFRQPLRSRRQMYTVDRPCAKCGENVHELPFELDPEDLGRPIYCPSCYMKVLSQRRGGRGTTVVGDALNQGLQQENERLKERVEELLEAVGDHSGKDTGRKGKLSKKDRRQRERFLGPDEET